MKNEREKALFLAQLKDFANTLSDKIAVNDEWTIKGFIDIFKTFIRFLPTLKSSPKY